MGELTAVCQNGSIRYLDTQLKGAATGVLLFFLMNLGVCFSEDDLQFYTGYSRPTLHRALRSLARYELVQQLGERPVWSLTAHIKQLTFVGDLAEFDEKKFFSASSSSSTDPDPDKNLLTTSTRPPEKNFFREEVAKLLQACGVFAAPAKELAADPWVTEERVRAWVRQLRADRRVRSVGAVLYTNLRNHLEAGLLAEEKPSLICPRCHMRPCICDVEWGSE